MCSLQWHRAQAHSELRSIVLSRFLMSVRAASRFRRQGCIPIMWRECCSRLELAPMRTAPLAKRSTLRAFPPCGAPLRRCMAAGARGSARGDVASDSGRLFAAAALAGGCAVAAAAWQFWPSQRVAGPRPTDTETLDAILSLLQKDDCLGEGSRAAGRSPLFVDLGSGDGRVVLAVARRFPGRCRCVGVEVMADAVETSQKAADAVETLAPTRFVCADMGEVDLSDVDVLFLYLPQQVVRQVVLNLLPQSGLQTGARVVIEDAPRDFRESDRSFGMKLLRSGGVMPPSPQYPTVDVFEWRGSSLKDKRRSSLPERKRMPLWSDDAERA
eukprot:TRINITY_DN8619_c0_g3_i1.p1 TRINITY_DN8619_c0_g3~~TRINITY_DN8619_c0_g3_i1.p1  ORF type:complete len:328 (-),score=45.21 TRINITY_DN8619_c0_g3_i1:43-1026(-)